MTFILFCVASTLSWFSAKELYEFWILKNRGKAIAKLGAVSAGILIFLFSLAILRSIFDTAWTGIVFIILCILILLSIKNAELLNQHAKQNNKKPINRKQLIGFFGVATFILMVLGVDKSVDQTNTPLPANEPVSTTSNNTTPVMLQSVEPEQTASTTEPSDNLATDDSTPIASVDESDSDDEIASNESSDVFDDSEDDNCGGLPTRCGDMRDCAQAERALACGNQRLDRDNDGIPCESICG